MIKLSIEAPKGLLCQGSVRIVLMFTWIFVIISFWPNVAVKTIRWVYKVIMHYGKKFLGKTTIGKK